jgi:hypothetical protein
VVIGTPSTSTSDAGLPAGVLAHQVLVTNVQIEESNGEPSRDETQTKAPTKNLLVTIALDDASAAKVLAFAADDNVWLGAEQADLSGSASS